MAGDSAVRLVLCPVEGDGWHLYCKWHAGRWAGHYVYWRVWDPEGLADGLVLLGERYEQVLAGTRRPLKDSPRPQ